MKILIYMPENNLRPIGGPAGYLYNLYAGLKEIGSSAVDFLPSVENKKYVPVLKSVYHKFPYKFKTKIASSYNKISKKFISEERVQEKVYNNYRKLLFGNSMLPANYKSYDIIHFHTTFELYKEKELLKDYTGKVVLNSHSPQPNHQEYMVLFNNHPKRDEVLTVLELADEFAFDRADAIFFPCKYAEEPYFNNWNKYKEIYTRNAHKYQYLLTGIKECNYKVSKAGIRKKYNIPNDAFLICYVGRHNEIKGYDILKRVAEKILSDNKDIYFIISGKEGPLYGINSSHWIETGWTDDPYSIMNASNLFILPNRETYFDLILLEVMSLGIPIIASNTGGNKYFKNQSCKGIQLFNSEQDLEEKIIYAIKNEGFLNGSSNKEYFEKYFNEKVFANNYLELMQYLVTAGK